MAMVRRFTATVSTGSTTLRRSTAKTIRLVTTTQAMTHGNQVLSSLKKSYVEADSPATWIWYPSGAGRLLSALTRSCAWAELGAPVGVTWKRTAPGATEDFTSCLNCSSCAALIVWPPPRSMPSGGTV